MKHLFELYTNIVDKANLFSGVNYKVINVKIKGLVKIVSSVKSSFTSSVFFYVYLFIQRVYLLIKIQRGCLTSIGCNTFTQAF